MPMTPAERQKLYRERLKQRDPDKFLAQKKSNAERTKMNRKKIADFDSSQQETIRQQWREKKRNKEIYATPETTKEISPSASSEQHLQHVQKLHRKVINKFKKEKLELKEEQMILKTSLKNMKKKLKRTVQKNKKILKLLEEKKITISQLQKELHEMKTKNRTNWTPQTKTDNFIEDNLPNITIEEKNAVKKKILQHEVILDTLKECYQSSSSTEVKKILKNVLLDKNAEKYKFKRKIASFLGLKGNIRHTTRKKRNGILVNHLKDFFERDDVSRMTAGKNETKTKKNEKRQKRYLLGTLKKLYRKYRCEGGKLALSTFKKYRPFYVVAPTVGNRNTCACKRHDNLEMKAKALKCNGILATQDIDELLAMVMCETKRRECAYGECELCKERSIEFTLNKTNLDDNISWYEWILQSHEYKDKNDKDVTKVTKKNVKKEKTDTLRALLTLFKEELHNMKKHSYNITHQYKEYRRCIESLDERSVLLHIDFSENYVCKLSKEIQSMHFGCSKQQVTIHAGILYTTNNKIPIASISPNTDHGPDAIWAHLQPVLKWIKERFPKVDSIHFFSDGPTTQYRQKKNFYFFSKITKEFGFTYSTWNFFEASHGKGAADGVGGALKRNLDSMVAYGYDIVDAKSAFDLLHNETDTSIKLFYISNEEITKTTLELIPVQNTMKLHQITNTDMPYTIMYRSLSCFCTGDRPGFCHCLDVKQCNLIKKIDTATNKEKETDQQKVKLIKTSVKILSDIKNTAENRKYFDLTKYGPFQIKNIDKIFDVSRATTSKFANSESFTSDTMTSVKTNKRKTVTKTSKKNIKKYKLQQDSSTDDDVYSLRESDDDEYILDKSSSDELFLTDENLEMVPNLSPVRSKYQNEMNALKTKKLNDKDIIEYINDCSDAETIKEEYKNDNEVRKNDSVLVRYYQRGTWKYYAGFVEDKTEKSGEIDYKISFLKTKKHPKLKFVSTKKKDWDIVNTNSIVKKIGLKRDLLQQSQYYLRNSCDEVYFN